MSKLFITKLHCNLLQSHHNPWAMNSETQNMMLLLSLLLTLTRPGFFGCFVAGGGGGGLNHPPPPPEFSAVDRAITMKIGTYVTCGVIYQTIKKIYKNFHFLLL